MIKVSIVIPYHNHGAYIGETLDSVRSQTFRDIEVILIDDGSTDVQSVRILEELERQGVLIVLRRPRQGPSNARNAGIAKAQGTYILPLDADDLLAPTAVESLVAALESSGAAVAIPRAAYFGCRRGEVFLGPWDRRGILLSNAATCTALFRKSDWDLVGGYNENMTEGYEDWDFWMSFLERKLPAVKLADILFYYRIKPSSRNPTKESVGALGRMHAQMLRNHSALFLENADVLLDAYYRARQTTWLRLLMRRITGIGSRIEAVWARRFPTKSPLASLPKEHI